MGGFRSRSRRINPWRRSWRRKPATVAVVVALLAALVAIRYREASGPDHDRYHNRVFRCQRVVDGDTLDIDTPDGKRLATRIRLWGVDTPETTGGPRGAMYFGPEASAFTRTCVESKEVRVVLASDQTRDKYGRLLAYIYFGDPPQMLNEEIISRGYGYADTRFSHVWLQRFKELEARARRDRKGLWEKVRPDQMPTWRQKSNEPIIGSVVTAGH